MGFEFDALSLFGLCAVSASLLCYAMEKWSPWWTLGFVFANLAAAGYGFAEGAWPFGLIEIFWGAAAFWRWLGTRKVAPL
ncbi:MAG: hypothetical protein KA220_01335 [Phenylobacterium sp.]|nr:hypothetical protein [Phenylobacterium sp.]